METPNSLFFLPRLSKMKLLLLYLGVSLVCSVQSLSPAVPAGRAEHSLPSNEIFKALTKLTKATTKLVVQFKGIFDTCTNDPAYCCDYILFPSEAIRSEFVNSVTMFSNFLKRGPTKAILQFEPVKSILSQVKEQIENLIKEAKESNNFCVTEVAEELESALKRFLDKLEEP